MKATKKVGIGILCMGAGVYGLTLDIDNVGHYFGTGTIFGIGLSLVSATLYKQYKYRSKEEK